MTILLFGAISSRFGEIYAVLSVSYFSTEEFHHFFQIAVANVFVAFLLPTLIIFFPFLALLMQLCGGREPRLEQPHSRYRQCQCLFRRMTNINLCRPKLDYVLQERLDCHRLDYCLCREPGTLPSVRVDEVVSSEQHRI